MVFNPIQQTQLTGLKLVENFGSGNAGPSPCYFTADPQILAMANAQKALVMTIGATLQVLSNTIYADPGGGSVDLLLPPEADCFGLWLWIVNTADAAETITVKEDSDTTTIASIGQNQRAVVFCDGTTWHGGVLLSGTEGGYLNGLTAGTVTASKATVVDSNKDLGDFRNLDATNLDAGLSGTAGTVDIFPGTAAKGKIALTAADSAGDTTTTIVNASQAAARTYTIPDAGAAAEFALNIANVIDVKCQAVSFTEDGSGTSYTGTVVIPAGSLVLEIQFRSTVVWDGTSASLVIGDDGDADGYFTATDLKATDLLVGEVLSITNSENWGGNQGVYLVAATGLKSATYYAAANNIIAVVTPGAADGSAGRSFMHVFYATPTEVASTNV